MSQKNCGQIGRIQILGRTGSPRFFAPMHICCAGVPLSFMRTESNDCRNNAGFLAFISWRRADIAARNFKRNVSRQPQQGTSGIMRHLARSFIASLLITVLLIPALHAQPFPESERQKAGEERKKAEEKATDEAYKDTLRRSQDVKKTVDPWGNLRLPPAGSNK